MSPQLVIEAHEIPAPETPKAKAERITAEQKEYALFSDDMDNLMKKCINLLLNEEKLDNTAANTVVARLKLDQLRADLEKTLAEMVEKGKTILQEPARQKTLMMDIDEFLLDFLEKTMAGALNVNTLKKRRCACALP